MRKVFLLLTLSGLLACSEKEETVKETILAKVADKSISVNEFIRRAEYTIRPAWCKSDNYIHRKIVLNSLIAEKLFALEAGTADTLLKNSEVTAFLKGRLEQSIRKIHFNKTATQNVTIDDNELTSVMAHADKKFRVRMIPVNDDALATKIQNDLISGVTHFDALAEEFSTASGVAVDTQEVAFDTPLDNKILQALFLNDVQNESVLGPVNLEKNSNVFIKVDGWLYNPFRTETKMAQLQKDVKERLTEIKAEEIYSNYLGNLMKGRKLEFNPSVFEKLVNIIGPDYFKTQQDKEQAFNKKFWNNDAREMYLNDFEGRFEQIIDEPILTLDGEIWSVKRLEEEINKHPLVFRNRKMPKKDFSRQFKLAVADLIRDKFITEDAYKKGYDKDPRVQRDYQMWKDNLLSLYHKNKILEVYDNEAKSELVKIEKVLNPLLEDIRKKYNDHILIDTDAFEKIELTSIDMFVIQRDVPFPVVVPEFPRLTTHNRLDYGSKMIINN
jgi:hypothetical protein